MTKIDWVPLGEIAEIRSGIGFPLQLQGNSQGKYPFAKVGDISRLVRSGGQYFNSAKNHISEEDLLELKAKPMPANTICFAKIGEAIRSNFRAITQTPCLVDNNVMGVTPGPQVALRYLYQYLKFVDFYPLAQSTTVPSLRKTDLEKVAVPLPSLLEQRQIASMLDRADAVRAKRREAITLLDDLTKSTFLDMFDFGIANNTWPTASLKDSVRTGTIVTYGIVQAGDEYPNGVAYIRTGDIKDGKILSDQLRRTDPQIAAKFSRSCVTEGDIVMSIRATVGTVAPVTKQLSGANLTQGTARICPGDSTAHLFLLHYLRSKRVQEWIGRQVKGATFREITLAKLRELSVVIPPRHLQDEFAHRIEAIDSLRSSLVKQLAELDSLFASLQHRAFRSDLQNVSAPST